MLTKDPTERFTLQGVLQNPWLMTEPPCPPGPTSALHQEGGEATAGGDMLAMKVLGQLARRGSTRTGIMPL